MARHLCLFVCVFGNFVISVQSWDVLTNMGLRRQDTEEYIFNNEYVFGACKSKKNTKLLYLHVHKTVKEVRDAAIIREYAKFKRLPRCTIMRASSYETDTYRVTNYNFEICPVRVNFCYQRRRYLYYYYEWYIPDDLVSGFSWDIYFYGPEGKDWVEPLVEIPQYG